MGTIVTATVRGRSRPAASSDPARRSAIVWIDAREAVVIRWSGDEPMIERLASDVPPHTKATRHVRYDPLARHGGGESQLAGDRRRIEHLDRFVDAVAAMLAEDDDLVLVGHGTVHERLESRLRELDAAAHRTRPIDARRADRRTERQLVADLREHMGIAPRRRRVGR